jgi:hypothetical protein
MKNKSLSLLLVFALVCVPALGEDKEKDRLESCGVVLKEILDIPDDIRPYFPVSRQVRYWI